MRQRVVFEWDDAHWHDVQGIEIACEWFGHLGYRVPNLGKGLNADCYMYARQRGESNMCAGLVKCARR